MNIELLIFLVVNLIVFFAIRFFIPKKKRKLHYLLFITIASPGLFIGNTLINLCDLFIPIVFLLDFSIYSKKAKDYYIILVPLLMLSISIVFSHLSALMSGNLSISMMLKSFRFLITIMSIVVIVTEFKKTGDKKYFIKTIYIYSYILCILSIFLFFYQNTKFSAHQQLWLVGKTMYRAGGIYGEASNFGFNMVIISILALYCASKRIMPKASYLLLFLSVINNVFSYTRISVLTFIVILLLFLLLTPINSKKVTLSLISIISILILYICSPIVNNFINNRLFALFHTSLNDSSSGRFTIWYDSIKMLIESDSLVFGIGYKTDGIFVDNCFLYFFVTTGVFGLIMLICVHIALIYYCSNGNKNRMFSMFLYLLILIMSITCEVMTYTRGLVLLLILLISLKTKEEIKTSESVERQGEIKYELANNYAG